MQVGELSKKAESEREESVQTRSGRHVQHWLASWRESCIGPGLDAKPKLTATGIASIP